MQFFDTHAHIGLINEDPIEQLIITQQAKQDNVDKIISISNNIRDFFQIYENLKTAENVYYAVGISPSEVQNPGSDWHIKIEDSLKLGKVLAIGEIGLDYYRKFGNRDSQIELFIHQLEMAQKLQYPVIIHNREAGNDVLDILKQELPEKGGLLHCYSEDYNYAQKALELNLYISFAGNVTYRNAKNLHETAKKMPLDRMLIETESPFMVPAAMRGKRNKPSYIVETAKFIAELREMPLEELTKTLYTNSLKFFNLAGV